MSAGTPPGTVPPKLREKKRPGLSLIDAGQLPDFLAATSATSMQTSHAFPEMPVPVFQIPPSLHSLTFVKTEALFLFLPLRLPETDVRVDGAIAFLPSAKTQKMKWL